ncbi:MAG: DNA repair protein RecN [Candidatus Eisenbacteria bacterium]|jgi:DNA repair protein RecN (Recombination protein N)|nr:DNA repair protein RecN [Candidatus Eisenbacteria bacterium]
MLAALRLSDFRVVERLEFAPGDGLNVVTGETGAGKSVLVGALEAALGQLLDVNDIRAPAEFSAVIAEFVIAATDPARERLRELLPDWTGGALAIERRVHQGGRTSCRIDGRVVSRETLMAVGDWLVDIHGQHGHQLLLSPAAQLDVLDEFAGLTSQRRQLGDSYRQWVELKRRVKEMREAADRADQEADRRAFQLGELRAARLTPGEIEALERELRILSTAHHWKTACLEAREILLESDDSVIGRTIRVVRTLQDLAGHFPDVHRALGGAESAVVELQELADVLRALDSQLQANPERQQEVEERLGLLIGLEKKHGLSHDGLFGLLGQLEHEASAGIDARKELARMETRTEEVRGELEERASAVSMERLRAAERLVPRVEAEFAALGLERARFAVRLAPQPVKDGFAGDAKGKERAVFLFSASPGDEPRELARVASGGELSRIMLALKSVLGAVDPVGTMVFDEIDTGVGGGLARVVGERLKALACHRQVLCVTHLAPVAGSAHHHFVVEKRPGDRVTVDIRRVHGETRVSEIARMLGGFPISEEARMHARAMVSGGEEEKTNERSEV